MPRIGNILEAADTRNYHTMCNEDGSCSGCGECCSDFLPLSDEEVRRIKKYTELHKLKPHNNTFAPIKEMADWTCPFRDNVNRKCDIYEVRPQICRSFICTKALGEANEDRKLIEKRRTAQSMRKTFFGDDSNEEMLRSVTTAIAETFAMAYMRGLI